MLAGGRQDALLLRFRQERELTGRPEHHVARQRVLVQTLEVRGELLVRDLVLSEGGQDRRIDTFEIDGVAHWLPL